VVVVDMYKEFSWFKTFSYTCHIFGKGMQKDKEGREKLLDKPE
jgi:hypothetical protein